VTLKEAAEYAPLVTASVAALAPLVAVVSISVQKGIARKRAAIDFFLKTEMDNEVFNDYAKSRSVFVALKPGKPMEVFCSSDDYSLVSKYLNLHELMAVGNSQGRLGRGRLLCILGRRSEARLLLFV
jgi:hypothetical protein